MIEDSGHNVVDKAKYSKMLIIIIIRVRVYYNGAPHVGLVAFPFHVLKHGS